MKVKFFLLVCFSGFFLLKNTSAQIITNGGFENWTIDTTGYLNPVGWFTNNGWDVSPPTVVQAPGRTGNYSARLVSVDTGNGFVTGSILFFYGGTLKPLMLSGFWKGNFTGFDGIGASISVLDSNMDEIGEGMVLDSLPTPNWTSFSLPVNYTSTSTPVMTWIGIVMVASTINTTGYVDDLTLTYTTGIGEIHTMQFLGLALERDEIGNYFISTNLLSPLSFTVNILSTDGKKISEKSYSLDSGNHQIPVCTNELEIGVYICRVIGVGINKSFKFIK
jgi:hypothetical protein